MTVRKAIDELCAEGILYRIKGKGCFVRELKDQKRLRAYMVHYLSVMMAVSDIFLLLDGSDEAKAKRTGLWQYLKDHVSTGVYRAVRYNLGGLTDLKFPGGDKLTLGVYRQLRKIFKFN